MSTTIASNVVKNPVTNQHYRVDIRPDYSIDVYETNEQGVSKHFGPIISDSWRDEQLRPGREHIAIKWAMKTASDLALKLVLGELS